MSEEEAAGILRDAETLVFVEDLESCTLTDEDAHHLRAVLRLRAGDPVVCSDGNGAWRSCVVGPRPQEPSAARSGASRPTEASSITLLATSSIGRIDRPRELTVAFALQKGERPDWTVQKLTELGIDRIIPLLTERTIVRLDRQAVAKRGERLRRIAREAASQSRRVHLPIVSDPIDLVTLLGALGPGLHLAEPGGGELSSSVSAIAIGPEGGWSQEELDRWPATVSLGPTILRAETAALVAGSLLAALRAGVVDERAGDLANRYVH